MAQVNVSVLVRWLLLATGSITLAASGVMSAIAENALVPGFVQVACTVSVRSCGEPVARAGQRAAYEPGVTVSPESPVAVIEPEASTGVSGPRFATVVARVTVTAVPTRPSGGALVVSVVTAKSATRHSGAVGLSLQ